MARVKRGLTGFCLGLGSAGLFNVLFFDWLQRSRVDQILSLSALTVAFGFLAFLWLEKRAEEKVALSFWDAASNFWRHWRGNLRASESKKWGALLWDHLPGLVLAGAFFLIYFSMGQFYNQPDFTLRDNYLDADNSDWIQRIAEPDGYAQEMRVTHPFAFFIFRPLGWAATIFWHTPSLTALFLNSLAGALSVFLAWGFVKTLTGTRVYAFLLAGLLGLSTAHFFFAAIVESYIFSALTLIGFYLYLLVRKENTGMLIAISLLTFGITLTNFVQTFLGFVVTRFRGKDIFRFTGTVLSLGIILTFVHHLWYPSSKPFFLLSSSEGEGVFLFSIFTEPAWNLSGRLLLLARTMLLNSVIAPLPFVFLNDAEAAFPTFQFFTLSKLQGTYLYSEYNGVGKLLVALWLILLFVAGLSFLWNFARSRKADLAVAFCLCLLFNFVLHLIYGEQPFLYSPGWTFALIFFVAMGLRPFAQNRLFQLALLTFLVLLAYNQWQFFQFIKEAMLAHLG